MSLFLKIKDIVKLFPFLLCPKSHPLMHFWWSCVCIFVRSGWWRLEEGFTMDTILFEHSESMRPVQLILFRLWKILIAIKGSFRCWHSLGWAGRKFGLAFICIVSSISWFSLDEMLRPNLPFLDQTEIISLYAYVYRPTYLENWALENWI